MASYVSHEAITVSTTSIPLTTPVGVSALITVENAAVRFRLDGGAPTATTGHAAEPGDTIELDSPDQLSNARFIRRDGVDATLRVSYGR